MINSIKELEVILAHLSKDEAFQALINEVITLCTKTFQEKRAIYFCGNGGSAAEAQHLSAEFSGRYKLNRRALRSEALNANSSFITAVANDYGYDQVFSRALEALGQEGDLVFILSTSGNSPNVIEVAKKARELGVISIAMTGDEGGNLANFCDFVIKVPSANTPRIQEIHLLVGHEICEQVEKNLFA